MSAVVLLNGCSSSGKSSIARAVQNFDKKNWLAFGIDLFIDMLPKQKMDTYFVKIPGNNQYGPTMHVQNTELGWDFFNQLPFVAQRFADSGFSIIIDEVLFEEHTLIRYRSALCDHTFVYVGVMCSLAELQKRESARKDRQPGLANDQFYRIHKGLRGKYDYTFDTTERSTEQCAQDILAFIANQK